MAVRLSEGLANTLADAVDSYIGTAGTIKIYSGTQPATADSSETGDLLATFSLDNPAFSSASSGVITLNDTPLTVAASNTGTAGWFRLEKGDNTKVLDGSVSTSGAQINLNTVSITSGVNVSITSGTITMPTS
jgi:hypothetical protein